jgi:hypothetical protein
MNEARHFDHAGRLAQQGLATMRHGSRQVVGGLSQAGDAMRAQIRARPAAATLLMAAAVMAVVALASLLGSSDKRT